MKKTSSKHICHHIAYNNPLANNTKCKLIPDHAFCQKLANDFVTRVWETLLYFLKQKGTVNNYRGERKTMLHYK